MLPILAQGIGCERPLDLVKKVFVLPILNAVVK
jgi:hypothetical protein